MAKHIERKAAIYKKAFEIAVRCARELNGTPELKEAYQEAQKDNRALKSFTDFCLEKAVEEVPECATADVVEVVRCRRCRYHHWEQEPCHGKTEHFCSVLNAQVFADFYCYYGAKKDGKGEGE